MRITYFKKPIIYLLITRKQCELFLINIKKSEYPNNCLWLLQQIPIQLINQACWNYSLSFNLDNTPILVQIKRNIIYNSHQYNSYFPLISLPHFSVSNIYNYSSYNSK